MCTALAYLATFQTNSFNTTHHTSFDTAAQFSTTAENTTIISGRFIHRELYNWICVVSNKSGTCLPTVSRDPRVPASAAKPRFFSEFKMSWWGFSFVLNFAGESDQLSHGNQAIAMFLQAGAKCCLPSLKRGNKYFNFGGYKL